jgi:hypothetical protein
MQHSVGNMDAKDAIEKLISTLTKEGQDRYCLSCHKAILFLRLAGSRKSLRFAARDQVGFRIDASHLIIEDLQTRAVRGKYSWLEIESVAAGEPESENRDLFQG